jgi:putative transposase
MKTKQFSLEQIVATLKQAELGMPVAGVTRQLGISEQTYDRLTDRLVRLQERQDELFLRSIGR